MNFYIAEPVTRLPLFNFLVRYIFTEVLFLSDWRKNHGFLCKCAESETIITLAKVII